VSRMTQRTNSLTAICLLGILLVFAASSAWGQQAPNDRLTGVLRALAQYATGGAAPMTRPSATPSQAALLAAKLAPNGLAQVVVHFSSPAGVNTGVVTAVGGRVQIIRDQRIQALIPIGSLPTVASQPGVAYVDLAQKGHPVQFNGPVIDEGVQLTNALQFQNNGIFGQGAKVAIIDAGFLNYATAQINNPLTIDFTGTGAFPGTDTHGSACAEICQDMAPAAQLTLGMIDTEMSVESAIDYLIANKYQVASFSIAFLNGPFNGLSTLDAAVNSARQSGVLWCTAAGNYAQRHWEGDYSDPNSTGFCNFSSGTNKMALNLVAGELFEADLSWFQPTDLDTGVTSHDYDLLLTDSLGNFVAQSAFVQNGSTPPFEQLIAIIPTAGVYNLQIEKMYTGSSAGDHFQLFLPNDDMPTALQVPAHSLIRPAEAQYAVTVGATRGATITAAELTALGVNSATAAALAAIPIDTLEPFSSCGPALASFGATVHKPDLVAPDGNTVSAAAAETPFLGTSCSTPQVAGAAALLYSENTARTADQLYLALTKKDVMPKAASKQTDIPDTYGDGRLAIFQNLDVTPPTIVIQSPASGDVIINTTPTVTAQITDIGTGVDPTTIQLAIDGVQVNFGTAGPQYANNTFTYQITTPLGAGAHHIAIDVKDKAGNAATEAVSYFRVTRPSIPSGLSMISIPYTNLVPNDPSSVLGVPFGSGSSNGLIRWYPLDTGSSKYRIYPDAYATFDPPDAQTASPVVVSPPAGLGYFVKLTTAASPVTQSGQAITATTYTINVPFGTGSNTGWAMIGDPYLEPIDWGSVQFVTNGVSQDIRSAIAAGVTEGVLFQFVGTSSGGYYTFPSDPLSATLEPFQGYWVHVLKSTQLVIYSSGATTASTRTTQSASTSTTDNWSLHVIASAGSMQDPTNVIGVSTAATGGYTPGQDVAKPPVLSDVLSSYIACSDLGAHSGAYARRILPAGANTNQWNFNVSSSLSKADATLQWPDLNSTVPGSVRLTLCDVDTGRQVYMRTATGYSFQTADGGGVRHFTITASTNPAATLALTGLTTQAVHGAGVTICYTLSAPAQVTMSVYNVSGVPIKSFAAVNTAAATTQSVMWNLVNDRGTKTPTGRYLARITAMADNGQTVQAICPFEVGY